MVLIVVFPLEKFFLNGQWNSIVTDGAQTERSNRLLFLKFKDKVYIYNTCLLFPFKLETQYIIFNNHSASIFFRPQINHSSVQRKAVRLMECFCLRDDLPLTKIMLCFLFVVFNNIASLNTFGSVLTPNEEGSLQNLQTCRIMFRLSLFIVLIQTSHPTADLWL